MYIDAINYDFYIHQSISNDVMTNCTGLPNQFEGTSTIYVYKCYAWPGHVARCRLYNRLSGYKILGLLAQVHNPKLMEIYLHQPALHGIVKDEYSCMKLYTLTY